MLGGAGTGGMLSFSALDANGKTILQRLPDIVPINEAQVVRKFLLENGLAPSPELSTRTVREVVGLLTEKFLCVHTWELCADGQSDMHGANAGAPDSVMATHSASGEIYMFEQCTSRVAKATRDTLARRPEVTEGSATTISQEATTTISEGTPPSPTPAVPAATYVDKAELPSLDTWLAELKLDKYREALVKEGYEELVFLCDADEGDIDELATEVGMKKPHAKTFKKACGKLPKG